VNDVATCGGEMVWNII